MEYINHITLNTGHIRKSYSSEVDKELYFTLKKLYNEIFQDGAEIIKGYKAKGINDPVNGFIFSIYGSLGEPILTTGIVKHKKSSIWELLHSTNTTPIVTKPQFPPEIPYIADRLEIGISTNMAALEWTAGFSKCMGWICLAPEKIRQR